VATTAATAAALVSILLAGRDGSRDSKKAIAPAQSLTTAAMDTAPERLDRALCAVPSASYELTTCAPIRWPPR